ncbi:glycosyltransferase family 2 protein [Candidatus Magnetomonas plexicatena]|nr:glycosyltransferase family 2 protein [Nitrospirales bacterium LBB_01]
MRIAVLKILNRIFPLKMEGDAVVGSAANERDVSCVINFYGRIDLLEGILYCLVEQDLPKDRYEVILVEDRGGTSEGFAAYNKFKDKMNVSYYSLSEKYGMMGYARNFAINRVKGKYCLLLDDDTILTGNDFLTTLIDDFIRTGADAIIPHGSAAFCLWKEKYCYHEPHFPTSRCMAYTTEVLSKLHGFVSSIIGQEDVEFVVRFLASGKKFYKSDRLKYLHPPFLVNNLSKPIAVGKSIAGLKKRYHPLIYSMLIVNGARHLPLLFSPVSMKSRMQGKFALGFIIGVFYYFLNLKADYK